MLVELHLGNGDWVSMEIPIEILALPRKKALTSIRKLLRARFGRAVAGIAVTNFVLC
jgi:hypothetical protein